MAALREDVIEQSDRTYLYSAYFDDHKDAANKIGAWLMHASATARIEAAFFAVTDPRLRQILSDAVGTSRDPG